MTLSFKIDMEEEHYIYLTNLANRDIYEDNTPCCFQNRLNPPIQLNPDKDYEVGLINCFYPKNYYGICSNDQESRIEVWATARGHQGEPFLLCSYVPLTNIEAGDTQYLVDIINKELSQVLGNALQGQNLKKYFKRKIFFQYERRSQRVTYVIRKRFCTEEEGRPFCTFTFKFGSRMSEILGFDKHLWYPFYGITTSNESTLYQDAPYQPKADAGVEYIMFYTDCVNPTRFGGQRVNVLEVITMESSGGRDLHRTAYKPLNKCLLDVIAIKVTDQSGRIIHFGKEKSMTVLLHIRSK